MRAGRICSNRQPVGGRGLEPRFLGPKPSVLSSWTTPQRGAPAGRRRGDTTMRAVSAPTVVIIAAGEGTRMRSALPKVLHPLCGRPLILWPVLAARAAGAERVVVVEGPGEPLRGALPDGVDVAVQAQQNGTGDAVLAA